MTEPIILGQCRGNSGKIRCSKTTLECREAAYKSTDELVEKKVLPEATYDKIKAQIVAK